jgi:hypothetical protein
MDQRILVTGFRPFVKAPSTFTRIATLVEAGPRGVLMLGTDLQTSQCILEDGYCMRSYARALNAAKGAIPGAFVHVQSPPLANGARQLEQVSGLFNLIAAAAWPRQH